MGHYVLSHFSCVRLFVNPWTVAHQAPLSMGFSRQEYWSRLPFSSSGDLPKIEPASLCLLHWQVCSLPLAPPGKAWGTIKVEKKNYQLKCSKHLFSLHYHYGIFERYYQVDCLWTWVYILISFSTDLVLSQKNV